MVHQLTPEAAVPVMELRDKLTIFKNLKSKHAWTEFFRGSPAAFDPEDGKAVYDAIAEATINPVKREDDDKKYYRTPRTFESQKIGTVTVPEAESIEADEVTPAATDKVTPEDIQHLLLKLASDLGLDVCVAKNDRNKQYNSNA